MVELVDTRDLKSRGPGRVRAGSSPAPGTKSQPFVKKIPCQFQADVLRILKTRKYQPAKHEHGSFPFSITPKIRLSEQGHIARMPEIVKVAAPCGPGMGDNEEGNSKDAQTHYRLYTDSAEVD